MKTRVYLCKCGTNIADHLDLASLAKRLGQADAQVAVQTVDFLCSVEGREFLANDLRSAPAERWVMAACSPRDHEQTFRQILTTAGRNPYLLQLVNIREQVAWVTADPLRAESKALALINGAIGRVRLQQPLSDRELEITTATLVLGAGPAGMKCALTLAEAGRRVILVEKSPALGGKPVLFEEVAPDLQCGPCLLEPLMEELLHGKHAENIELLTLAELHDIKGSFGNFLVTIRQHPRHIDPTLCIGCYECIAPCPVSAPDLSDYQIGRAMRPAIAFAYPGVLPNVPAIDAALCLRSQGEACTACFDACPMPGAIRLEQEEELLERKVGALVVATGAALYDLTALPNLGYGSSPDVLTALEFERLLAANGPTEKQLLTQSGTPPESVLIIHCAGSLEAAHIPYCSGVCCTYALKFSHQLAAKLQGVSITHLYKELVLPGKSAIALAQRVQAQPSTTFQRFANSADLQISPSGGKIRVNSPAGETTVDMVILCPPLVPGRDVGPLAELLDLARDRAGFFEEAGERLDSASSKIKGIYLAGSCQNPGDIREAVNQGLAAAAYVMAGLVEGRNLAISPVVAEVDQKRCSGCRVCGSLCPYKAITISALDGKGLVNDVLCRGCGTCVAACPAGAIVCHHFTNGQILAELTGILT
ncbi:MAG: CoB--CoM heterodisulfide reductase iron-sulfur subunit A family protein [Desulfobulbaceae bacterium]|nr:CoB--CoM heterodisulfide reductase iron-sulfur subunit A family protein [Desulfobulbaceae bacterium]